MQKMILSKLILIVSIFLALCSSLSAALSFPSGVTNYVCPNLGITTTTCAGQAWCTPTSYIIGGSCPGSACCTGAVGTIGPQGAMLSLADQYRLIPFPSYVISPTMAISYVH